MPDFFNRLIFNLTLFIETKKQQSLKEKENHIAQLLKERDFERAEFTKAAQKFEQVNKRLQTNENQSH